MNELTDLVRRQPGRALAIGTVAAVALVAAAVGIARGADEKATPGSVASTGVRAAAPPRASALPSPSQPSSPIVVSPAAPQPPSARPTTVQSVSRGPLAGFHFSEENDPAWQPTPGESTVSRSNDVRAAWNLDPCNPTDYPTDRRRVAMASLEMEGPEHFGGRQLAVYVDETTAAEVMAGFRRVLAACAAKSGDHFGPLDLGDEGLVVWQPFYYQGRQVPGGGYDVIVREGRSVYLAVDGGEFMATGPNDEGAQQLAAAARRTLPLPQ